MPAPPDGGSTHRVVAGFAARSAQRAGVLQFSSSDPTLDTRPVLSVDQALDLVERAATASSTPVEVLPLAETLGRRP